MDASPTIGSPGRRLGRDGIWLLVGSLAMGLGPTTIALVLAGLVSPSDFGVVAAAIVIFELLLSGLSLGTGQALQALPRSVEMDRTAFTFSLTQGVALAGLFWVVAPVAAQALTLPTLVGPVRWLSIGAIARRVSEVRAAQLERDFRFRASGLRALGAAAGGFAAAGVTLARDGGANALISYTVAAEVMLALLLCLGHPRLTWGWDRGPARRIARFGRDMAGSSVAVALYTNGDDLAVAHLGGPGLLGIYNFAYRLPNLATLMLARPIQRGLLPRLRAASVRGEPWTESFRTALQLASFGSGILMFGLATDGQRVLNIVYSQKWVEAASPLRIFTAYGLFRALGAVSGTVFIANGDPGTVRRIASWQMVGLAGLIVPMTLWLGAVGAAIAVTVPLVVGTSYALDAAAKISHLRRNELVRAVLMAWSVAGGAVVCGSSIGRVFGGTTGVAVTAGITTAIALTVSRSWFRRSVLTAHNGVG